MSEALNVIKAHFGALREVTTAPVWQYNYGQKLEIDGIPNLPSTFEIHYSNSKSRGTAKRWIGYDGVVDVLDEYFRSGADIWGFIFLHEGEDDGETEYVIHIPVKERSEAEDSEPTPMQRDIVDETIAALNQAVEYAEHIATNAGFMEIGINSNGQLEYTYNDKTDVDFALDSNGNLVMEVV